MRALSILGASLVAVLIATQSGVAFPAASTSPPEGPVPTVVHPLAGPSWSVTSVCGGTTHAGRVEPGPTCSPNPPDVIPASINQGSIYATSAQTGQVLFWDSGWENHPGAAYQQTWEFDNGTWTNDTTATGSSHPNPEPNAEVGCMTWDPLGDYFLALSGMTALGATGGVTWAFSNHQWTNLSTDIPDFGGTCAMAWDYADNEAVAYFINAAFDAAYTYVWTGEGWNDITNSSGTPALGCVAGNGMAWDAYDREVVSFGGQRACSTSRNVNWTWAFSGGVWTNLTSELVPEPPAGQFNEIAGVSGGVFLMTEGSTFNVAPEFWFFGAGNWTQETVAPDPTHGSACQRNGGVMGAVNGTTAFLFGGQPIATSGSSPCHWNGGGYFNDSWKFTGTPALGSSGAGNTTSPPGNGTASHPSSGPGGGLSCDSVILTWSNGPAPSGTTLVNVTLFLYRGTSNDSTPVQIVSTNGPVSSLQVNGLTCGSGYIWQVRDWYSSGLPGPLSGAFGFSTEGTVTSPPATCLSCGTTLPWWPWLVLALVIVAAVGLVYAWTRGSPRRGDSRRIG